MAIPISTTMESHALQEVQLMSITRIQVILMNTLNLWPSEGLGVGEGSGAMFIRERPGSV